MQTLVLVALEKYIK